MGFRQAETSRTRFELRKQAKIEGMEIRKDEKIQFLQVRTDFCFASTRCVFTVTIGVRVFPHAHRPHRDSLQVRVPVIVSLLQTSFDSISLWSSALLLLPSWGPALPERKGPPCFRLWFLMEGGLGKFFQRPEPPVVHAPSDFLRFALTKCNLNIIPFSTD